MVSGFDVVEFPAAQLTTGVFVLAATIAFRSVQVPAVPTGSAVDVTVIVFALAAAANSNDPIAAAAADLNRTERILAPSLRVPPPAGQPCFRPTAAG
jgi:hypothetical protein